MNEQDRIFQRLAQIHERIEWMASEEARAAWVSGAAADGRFWDEKLRLIEETDELLDKLEEGVRNA